MANYTAAELRAFKIKDVFQARMSALKSSSTNNEGKAKKSSAILKEADEYFAWLTQELDPIPAKVEEAPKTEVKSESKQEEKSTTKSSEVLPKPASADENRVLKAIFEKVGANSQSEKEAVARKVLNWAEKVHGVTRYPSMDNSVDEVVEYISN